jgi:hypothetical protein
MTKKTVAVLGLAISGLLLSGSVGGAYDYSGLESSPRDQQLREQELQQDSSSSRQLPEEGLGRERGWQNQNPPQYPSPSGVRPGQDPRFHSQQRGMSRQPVKPPGTGGGTGNFHTPEREPLHMPPPSVQPMRNGPGDPRFRPEQPGPRRFAPTPDFNGSRPFGFERRDSGPGQRRMQR